jgi:2-keto-3-deoxy-L-rhamnonate aldolase RhmA
VCVLVESAGAVDRVAEIAAVEGVDIVLLGIHDLSTSVGLPGENLRHPKLYAHLERVVQGCRRHKKVVWTTTVTTMEPDYVALLEKAGLQMISFYTDEGIFLKACKRLLETKSL